MSRPMYNGRTAAEWFQIWQEDTDALQRKVKQLQQELDDHDAVWTTYGQLQRERAEKAEREARVWQDAAARLEREKWGLTPDPETALD